MCVYLTWCVAVRAGKPNALMFRTAAAKAGVPASACVMVGDRMDTDIVGGMEAGMETVLVLSGITRAEDLPRFAFRPTYVMGGVAEMLTLLTAQD
jgi:NagD protein